MAGKNTGLTLGIIFSVSGILIIIIMAEQPLNGTTLPLYILESLTLSLGLLCVGPVLIVLYFKKPELLDELFRRKKKMEMQAESEKQEADTLK